MRRTCSLWPSRYGLRKGRYVDGLYAHCIQQLQGKGKAELSLVDAIDKYLDVDRHALGFKPTGEFLVRDVLALTKVFNDGLGSRLVKVARFHQRDTYMVFSLSTS